MKDNEEKINGLPVIYRESTTRAEQETIINYDVTLDEWLFFTNYPPHARKWQDRIIPSDNYQNNWIAFNEETDSIMELSGKIDGSATVLKRREYTEEERKKLAERMKASMKN